MLLLSPSYGFSMKRLFYAFILILMCSAPYHGAFFAASAAEPTKNVKLTIAEKNPVAIIACKAYKILTNGVTKGIIVFLFLVTGLGFFIGKVSWGIVISLLIGTVLTLGSGTLVVIFVGGAGAGGNGTEDVCKCKYGLDEDCQSAFNT